MPFPWRVTPGMQSRKGYTDWLALNMLCMASQVASKLSPEEDRGTSYLFLAKHNKLPSNCEFQVSVDNDRGNLYQIFLSQGSHVVTFSEEGVNLWVGAFLLFFQSWYVG